MLPSTSFRESAQLKRDINLRACHGAQQTLQGNPQACNITRASEPFKKYPTSYKAAFTAWDIKHSVLRTEQGFGMELMRYD